MFSNLRFEEEKRTIDKNNEDTVVLEIKKAKIASRIS